MHCLVHAGYSLTELRLYKKLKEKTDSERGGEGERKNKGRVRGGAEGEGE